MAYLGNFTADGALRCATTIGSISLPAGAAIEAKQLPDNHQVTVSNASIPVTGTFFPATQPVSAVSLPLPTGAATAANQLPDNHQVNVSNTSLAITAATLPLPTGAATAANQLPDNHQVSVSNFPVTQPISAVVLPLPAGAATAANQLPNNHEVTVTNFASAPTGGTVTIGDSANLDAFSRLRVAEPKQLFQTQMAYDLDPIDMESGATGTGVAPVFDTNVRIADLAITAGTGTSFMQSYQYIQYQPGKSQLMFMTFVFGVGVANITKDIGYFDSENGAFIRQNGTNGIQAVLRTSTSGSVVDQIIDSANFNLDTLDGTGISGLTFNEVNSQILVIDLQFLGMGRVRLGFDITGTIFYFHEFVNANNIAVPYMQTAALPVQILMTATASGAGSTFKFKCASVVSEGGVSNVPTALANTPEVTFTAASGTRTHAISIRPKLLFKGLTNRSTGQVEGVYILNTSANEIFYEIVHGAAFSVTPTFNDVNTTFSAFEYGSGGTFANLTNGIAVDSGYLIGGAGGGGGRGATGGTQFQEFLPITLNRVGAHRDLGTWTLLVTGIGGTADVRVSLRVREFR